MPRIRSIKPDFWVWEEMSRCSVLARLTFIGLWTFADDHGVYPARPLMLRGLVYPLDWSVSTEQVQGSMDELIAQGVVVEFTAEGSSDKFWRVVHWKQLQRIEKPTYKYSEPPLMNSSKGSRVVADASATSLQGLSDSSVSFRRALDPGVEGKGKELSGQQASTSPVNRTSSKKRKPTELPDDFVISDRVKLWAIEGGVTNLQAHFEAFKEKCKAAKYKVYDWDALLMQAIQADWLGSGSRQSVARDATAKHSTPDAAETAAMLAERRLAPKSAPPQGFQAWRKKLLQSSDKLPESEPLP